MEKSYKVIKHTCISALAVSDIDSKLFKYIYANYKEISLVLGSEVSLAKLKKFISHSSLIEDLVACGFIEEVMTDCVITRRSVLKKGDSFYFPIVEKGGKIYLRAMKDGNYWRSTYFADDFPCMLSDLVNSDKISEFKLCEVLITEKRG